MDVRKGVNEMSNYEPPAVTRRAAVDPTLIGFGSSAPAPSAVFAPTSGSAARSGSVGYAAPAVIRRSGVDPMLNAAVASSAPIPFTPTD